jgi:asparagine synthase (glutamine-hydrolysing)
MSAQFGKCNFDGKPVEPQEFDRVRPMLALYGPDGEGFLCKDNVGILYRAFHTTKESRNEVQPYTLASGDVFTWDGRLDNREELIGQLRGDLWNGSTDLSIVAAAYEHWGTSSFSKLSGDWAVSIWHPEDRTLVLAKDFVGTRHLYYRVEKDHVSWSSILDSLVLLAGHSFALEREYIAGWLSFFPSAHLTPYVGIRSVPPASFVALSPERHAIKKFWDFNPTKQFHYRTDSEYEEHFCTVFGEAVRRRLRSDFPILAELSGGVDSSSIVCMADTVIARGAAETCRLDTLSYYDESEPNWNERPYFTAVEKMRGRTGFHIDVSSEADTLPEYGNECIASTPGACKVTGGEKQFRACLKANGNRVLLSGIGGDEVLGGVPTPVPELANCVARAHVGTLAHQLLAWALVKREPLLHLLAQTIRAFLPGTLVGVASHQKRAPWLDPRFAKRYRAAFTGYQTALKMFGPLPSFQENLATLDLLRRQLSCAAVFSEPPCEKRYPYLDRDLLEFLFAIPREQLVRPHQRRSLMRRALVGVVPDQVLNRKRKAFVARGPLAGLSTRWTDIVELTENMVSSSLGFIDGNCFLEILEKARHGQDVPIIALMRTLDLELWLRHLRNHGVLSGDHGVDNNMLHRNTVLTKPLRTSSAS